MNRLLSDLDAKLGIFGRRGFINSVSVFGMKCRIWDDKDDSVTICCRLGAARPLSMLVFATKSVFPMRLQNSPYQILTIHGGIVVTFSISSIVSFQSNFLTVRASSDDSVVV